MDGVENQNLVWKDTAIVPVGSTMDMLVEMSNPGEWMIHCHIAEHLHAGMMFGFTVTPTRTVRPTARAGLASVAAMVAGGLLFLSLDRILEQQRTEGHINSLREEIYRGRVASDRCRGSLQTSQAALLELGVAIDSLKRVVEDYETVPGRRRPGAKLRCLHVGVRRIQRLGGRLGRAREPATHGGACVPGYDRGTQRPDGLAAGRPRRGGHPHGVARFEAAPWEIGQREHLPRSHGTASSPRFRRRWHPDTLRPVQKLFRCCI